MSIAGESNSFHCVGSKGLASPMHLRIDESNFHVSARVDNAMLHLSEISTSDPAMESKTPHLS